jgi:hypothetical protein
VRGIFSSLDSGRPVAAVSGPVRRKEEEVHAELCSLGEGRASECTHGSIRNNRKFPGWEVGRELEQCEADVGAALVAGPTRLPSQGVCSSQCSPRVARPSAQAYWRLASSSSLCTAGNARAATATWGGPGRDLCCRWDLGHSAGPEAWRETAPCRRRSSGHTSVTSPHAEHRHRHRVSRAGHPPDESTRSAAVPAPSCGAGLGDDAFKLADRRCEGPQSSPVSSCWPSPESWR